MRAAVLLPFLAVGRVLSQNTNSDEDDENQAITESLSILAESVTTTIDEATVPTGDYITYTTTSYLTSHGTVIDSTAVTVTSTPGSNITVANATTTSTSDTVTVLMGGQTTISGNATNNATQTSSQTPSATPVVNTQPCNGWPEFCNRKYSNITMVAAHNSPFVVPGNVASNQALGVQYQLDDGVRMRRQPRLSKLKNSQLTLYSTIPSPQFERHHAALPQQL
jgi:hypothetical protein